MFRMQLLTTVLVVFVLAQTVQAQVGKGPLNVTPVELNTKYRGGACNFDQFTQAVLDVQKRRKERLLTAEEFAKLAATPGTVVLDARSERSFELLHAKGSINLPYTDFGIRNLEKIIPDESSKILIYCRNNISNESLERAELSLSRYIVAKQPAAGLNLPVAVTLLIYGYKNVWELDEIVDPASSPIEFEWTPKYREIADSIVPKAK